MIGGGASKTYFAAGFYVIAAGFLNLVIAADFSVVATGFFVIKLLLYNIY